MKYLFLTAVILFCTAAVSALQLDSSYKIVIPDKKDIQDFFAAEELAKYLNKVTKHKFPIVAESAFSGGNAIFVGSTQKAEKSGSLTPDEYRIYIEKNNIVIAGSPWRGVLFGVYEFLERFAGVRFFTPECERIPNLKVLTVPDKTDIRYKSPFSYRFIYAGKRKNHTTGFFRKMRLTGWQAEKKYGSSARFGTDSHCHTYFKYSKDFPREISWADSSGKRHVVDTAFNGSICFSQPEVLRRMAERLKNNIAKDREKAKKQGLLPPEKYSVSQNDCDAACGCADCQKFIRKHGVSGLVIDFSNRLAEIVCKDYPDVNIVISAYFDSLNPPRTAIRPHKNITVQVATYTKTFRDHLRSIHDPVNREYMSLLTAWSKAADSVSIWDYWRYFSGFKPPAPAVMILADNIRAYRKFNVNHFFAEFEMYPKDLLSFFDMTFYVGAGLLNDPSKDPQVMIDEFADTYYGAAAPAMKKLLVLLTESVKQDKERGEYINFEQRSYMKNPVFFRQAFALISEAEKAVGSDKKLLVRIHQEKIILQSSYLKAWKTHKNKLKLNRKQLQKSVSEMLYPVLKTFFNTSVLSKKTVAEAESYYAEKVVFDKAQSVKAVPIENFVKKHPGAKIIPLEKISCRNRTVVDKDSPYGKAFSHSANYSPEMREKRHKRTFIFGIYEKSYAKHLVHGSINSLVLPQDEKYHWYSAGTVKMYKSLSLWLHWTWGLSVSLGKYYDEKNPDKKYSVYFLLKHQGPAYVKDSKLPNDVCLAAIALMPIK